MQWCLKFSPRNDTPVLLTFHWPEHVIWPHQTSESDERGNANIYVYIYICICILIIKNKKKGIGAPSLLRNSTATLGKIWGGGEHELRTGCWKKGDRRVMDLWRGGDEVKYREEKFIPEILIWGLFSMSVFILFLWKSWDLLIQWLSFSVSVSLAFVLLLCHLKVQQWEKFWKLCAFRCAQTLLKTEKICWEITGYSILLLSPVIT